MLFNYTLRPVIEWNDYTIKNNKNKKKLVRKQSTNNFELRNLNTILLTPL
jgi:hypothetical protein